MRLFKYRYVVHPLLKTLIIYTAIIGAFLLLLLSGCGTRNVALDASKTNTKQKDEIETVKELDSSSEGKEVKEAVDTKEKKNDITIIETTKKYDASGTLIEDHTKTIIDKSDSKSTSNRKSVKSFKKTKRWIERTKTYKLQIVTTKVKHKAVDADKSVVTNFGGKWVMFGLGSLAIVGIFLYFYLKNQATKWKQL